MPDNVNVTPGVGEVIAADGVIDPVLGAVKVQYVKIMSGAIDGVEKAVVTEGGFKVDASGVTLDVSATTSLPLPAGAATEVTLAARASEATVAGLLTDTQLRAAPVPVSASALPLPSGASTSALQATGNAALDSIDGKLPAGGVASEATLATRLSESAYVTRTGEVTASPAANTVLGRLQDIVAQLDMRVRGLFDSLGNAISSALNLGERRILVSAIEERHRRSNNGQIFGAGLFAQNVAAGAQDNWLFHIHNPPGSGKTILIDKWWFISFTNYVRFAYVLNPTVTANGTIITPTNLKAGGPASAALVYSLPTVTAATGLRFKEAKAGPSSDSIEVHDDFCIELAEGNRLVISGLPDGNNRLASISTQWAEVDS